MHAPDPSEPTPPDPFGIEDDARIGGITPGEMLRELRARRGLTQIELAEISGMQQAVISALETGRARIGIERAKRLARALDVHPAVIAFADWKATPTTCPLERAGASEARHDGRTDG